MIRHVSHPLAHGARATSTAARAQPRALALRSLSSRSHSRSVTPRQQGGSGGTSQVMPRGQGGPPLASWGRLFDDFGLDVLNDPFFRPFFGRGPGGGALEKADISMGLDIAETDKEYVVKAELAGIKKEDIKVTFNEGILNITAERKSEEVKEDEHHQHHYSDFTYGKVSRSLRVPDAAEKEQVDAQLEDGVLTVKIAKGEHSKPKEIPVK